MTDPLKLADDAEKHANQLLKDGEKWHNDLRADTEVMCRKALALASAVRELKEENDTLSRQVWILNDSAVKLQAELEKKDEALRKFVNNTVRVSSPDKADARLTMVTLLPKSEWDSVSAALPPTSTEEKP